MSFQEENTQVKTEKAPETKTSQTKTIIVSNPEDKESKNYLKNILKELKISVSDDKKIENAIKKIKNRTSSAAKTATQKNYVASSNLVYLFILKFLFFIAFIFAIVFYNGLIYSTISDTITFLFKYLEDTFSFFALNSGLMSLYSRLIVIMIYISILIFFFPSTTNEWKSTIYSKENTIFWIVTSLIILWGALFDPSLGFAENTQIIKDDIAESQTSWWLSFKCDTLKIIYESEPDCVKLKNQNVAQVVGEKKISVSFDREYSTRPYKTLETQTDSYKVRYNFETQTPITLLGIECYTDKDLKKPFYNTTIDTDNIVDKDTHKDFECLNLGTILEKQEEDLQIITKLKLSVESEFTQDVIVLNCKNQEVLSKLKQKDYKCSDLILKDAKDLFENELKSYNPRARGSNVVTLDTQTLDDDMPLAIGDGYEKNMDLQLGIKKNKELGKLESGKILSITLPKSLISKDDKLNSQSEEINQINDEIYASYKIAENEGFSLNPQDIIFLQNLNIKTQTTLVNEGRTTGKVKVKANFKINKEEEPLETKTSSSTDTTSKESVQTNSNTQTTSTIPNTASTDTTSQNDLNNPDFADNVNGP